MPAGRIIVAILTIIGFVVSMSAPVTASANKGARAPAAAAPLPKAEANLCYKHDVAGRTVKAPTSHKLESVRISVPAATEAMRGKTDRALEIAIGVRPFGAPGWYSGTATCLGEGSGQRRMLECEIADNRGWFSVSRASAKSWRIDILALALPGPNGVIEIGPEDSADRRHVLTRRKRGACI